jgi:glycosyltransferase involved in cell wall biosynthesis
MSPAQVSFILPTRNRADLVRRAVRSCLRVDGGIAPHVVVIEGSSDDSTFNDLTSEYIGDGRVQIVRQTADSPGFMPACFVGVDLVSTEWATFMYDDDVLSPSIGTMYREMIEGGMEFAVGFGRVAPVEADVQFGPVQEFEIHKPLLVLLAYFGDRRLRFNSFAPSPICCLCKTERLREWRREVEAFGNANRFRHYLLLERNIGPDLMIYLYCLLHSTTDVLVANAIIAHFSAHPDSMSVRYPRFELDTGYWLAGRWVIGALLSKQENQLAATCAGYLFSTGGWLALKAAIARRFGFALSIGGEVTAEVRRLTAKGLLIDALRAGLKHVVRRTLHGMEIRRPS